jgi:lysophospholipid acyltransferase (LPLAT)-like uncharacterized protein
MTRRRSRERSRWLPRLGGLIALLLRALGASWRVRAEGPDPFASGERPLLGALWHRGFLAAAALFRDRDAVVMVSRSRDGDAIEAVLRRLGYAASPRGSSSRGASSALRRQIALIAEGRIGALLCDGPRGPARHAKPGVLALARGTGAPLYPLAIAARPALRLASWDRTLVPLPFARVLCLYGEPLRVPRDASAQELENARLQLERELDRLTAEADARLGLPPEARS